MSCLSAPCPGCKANSWCSFTTSNAWIGAEFLLTPIELGMCSSLLLLDEKWSWLLVSSNHLRTKTLLAFFRSLSAAISRQLCLSTFELYAGTCWFPGSCDSWVVLAFVPREELGPRTGVAWWPGEYIQVTHPGGYQWCCLKDSLLFPRCCKSRCCSHPGGWQGLTSQSS